MFRLTKRDLGKIAIFALFTLGTTALANIDAIQAWLMLHTSPSVAIFLITMMTYIIKTIVLPSYKSVEEVNSPAV